MSLWWSRTCFRGWAFQIACCETWTCSALFSGTGAWSYSTTYTPYPVVPALLLLALSSSYTHPRPYDNTYKACRTCDAGCSICTDPAYKSPWSSWTTVSSTEYTIWAAWNITCGGHSVIGIMITVSFERFWWISFGFLYRKFCYN